MEQVETISLREFESLFKELYEDLCALANGYLNDVDAAEEAVQSTFVNFWENRQRVSIDTSVKAYLFKSVKNNCLNQIKHLKVKEAYKNHQQKISETTIELASDEVETNELETKILDAVNSLPKKRKNIFVLSRYEGLKYKEIATRLNISIKTVENQMGSALKQLRKDLAEYLVVLLILLLKL